MRQRERSTGTRRAGSAITIAVIAAMMFMTLGAGAASAAGGEPHPRGIRTPDGATYTVSLTSDADGFVWKGTQRISFTNVDPTPLKAIYLRLWDNAILGCNHPLAIQVTHVRGGTAGALTVGCTALRIKLPQPLNQGESAEISFDLKVMVPNTNWRFGRIGAMALVGNAIPVLAIRDALGWHLETYTSNGESFYSQVADFTVAFTTPRALKIAASGSIVRSKISGALRTRTFQADDVRDFAWACGPLSEEEQASPGGTLVKVWWTDPITKTQADAMLAVGMSSIDSHSAAYGAYPYPEIDLVIGNFTRFGGMEYPQLVMSDPSSGVIVHELAHQWWFGLVGDDEYTEPWLDEAFASYATDVYYGRTNQCAPPNWPSDTARVTNSMGYWDLHPTEYGPVVYTIGSCALHELASILGLKKMAVFMRDYAVEHTLGWSTTDAFKADAQAVADSLHDPVKLGTLWKTYRIDDVP